MTEGTEFVTVPREPTEEMLRSGIEFAAMLSGAELRDAFLAMVEAAPPDDAVGAAEREVGRYIYRRIEALMGAKAGTADGAELTYLAKIAESVEEYGEDACAGTSLAEFAAPSPTLPDVGELVERLNAACHNMMGTDSMAFLTLSQAASALTAYARRVGELEGEKRFYDDAEARRQIGNMEAAAIDWQARALSAEARLGRVVEAIEQTSGQIIENSPGPLFSAGFSTGVKHVKSVLRSAIASCAGDEDQT